MIGFNGVKTLFLIVLLSGLLLVVGQMVGGVVGLAIAGVLVFAMNIGSYWYSDKLILKTMNAHEVTAQQAPGLHRIVERAAREAGLPKPKVYVVDTPMPNAFATGRNPANAAVAVTTGLLRHLDYDEIAGVLAHELAPIRNRDTLIMTITATVAGAISMIANFALFFGGSRNNPLGVVGVIAIMILAPLAAMLVQMAISRSREYEADRVGA